MEAGGRSPVIELIPNVVKTKLSNQTVIQSQMKQQKGPCAQYITFIQFFLSSLTSFVTSKI